jgi:hypothetical protein
MENKEALQMIGLLVGLVVVVLLNNWIFPNDLARTVMAVLAAP